MNSHFYIFTTCSAVYGATFAFIAMRARHVQSAALALSCLGTAVWAGVSAAPALSSMAGPTGWLDSVRLLAWYAYLIVLYRTIGIGPARQVQVFGAIAVLVAAATVATALGVGQHGRIGLFSVEIGSRLLLSISQLLLIENMYLNLPEHDRWHVAIPCVLLGGIACFDILVTADAAIFHATSLQLLSARAVLLIVIAPLLILAAFRGQRWKEPVRLSRTAVFHSATLVLSGSVLLVLAGAGELLRQVNDEIGWLVELSLIASGLLGLSLYLSSRSARSAVQRVISKHMFADRYDYRAQWLQCISTLSGLGTIESTTLSTRCIRAIADVVDSPSGSLFLFENGTRSLLWSGSWNMPKSTLFPADQAWLTQFIAARMAVEISMQHDPIRDSSFAELGPVWLAVPLLHNANVVGLVVVGPPRLPFSLDQEVFDLLKIVGREVGTYVAEQIATEASDRTQQLHDYSKRFAFVAHDIKNVSSQLALLVQNAEHHLSNPEFQSDMVRTVQSSVQKINSLLRRLDQGSTVATGGTIDIADRLRELVEAAQNKRGIDIDFDAGSGRFESTAHPDTIDTIIGHLLNNAIEADPAGPIRMMLMEQAGSFMISIVDRGAGMSADFIRDSLFVPFKTSKDGGSGIGAFQARELVRELGGELRVDSKVGSGTRIDVILPTSGPAIPSSRLPALIEAGGGNA